MRKIKLNAGFGLVEIIVALGLFLIIAVTGVSTVLHSYAINRLAQEETKASIYAQEGIEAARSIKNQAWADLITGDHGLDSSSGNWVFSGSSNSDGKFTRVVTITPAQRDDSGNLVDTGGTIDPDMFKVTSTVTWNFSPSRNNTVTLETYLSRYEKCIWESAHVAATVNLASNSNANAMAYANNYAYVVTDNDAIEDEFYIVDVTDPNNPSFSASLGLGIFVNVNGVTVSGNYAYLATSLDNSEFIVIDVSNPSSPSQVASLNLGATQDATDVFTSGNYAYISKTNSTENELYIINISTPSSPSAVGGYEVNDDINAIFIKDNQAYIASKDNAKELEIVNVSNPASPSQTSIFDAAGNNDGLAIFVQNAFAFFGTNVNTNPELYILNVSNPASPSQLATYETGGNIFDIYSNDDFALLSTDNPSQELQILDISVITNPNLLASVDLSNSAKGAAMDELGCSLFVASIDNSAEFQVIQPGTSGPAPTPTPTPPPITTCNEYCIWLTTYSGGICRQNAATCTALGETYEIGGDIYCTGGPSADTCCCTP